MKIITAILALGASLVIFGCSPLAPQPDYSKFFMLSPISGGSIASPNQTSYTGGSQLTLGVGPIEFPDYLRRPEVVTVTSPNQLHLSVEKRWAEPLDKNFSRVLTENLTQLLNTEQVEKYPWSRDVHVDYQIVVDVQRFDTNIDGQSQLRARWIIKEGGTGKDLYASETRASVPVGAGEAGGSAALSEDLAALSRDIASQIAELDQKRSGART
ncbi:MAG: membrane integrity-associated transporter subunit PqiC [Candidatus Binataceae bacterium]